MPSCKPLGIHAGQSLHTPSELATIAMLEQNVSLPPSAGRKGSGILTTSRVGPAVMTNQRILEVSACKVQWRILAYRAGPQHACGATSWQTFIQYGWALALRRSHKPSRQHPSTMQKLRRAVRLFMALNCWVATGCIGTFGLNSQNTRTVDTVVTLMMPLGW